MPAVNQDARTPVTLLTGWLGAGKTTLLNRILADPQGHKFAVLVNEFGDIGVDDRLVTKSSEDLVELSNGCICCTVRGDLVKTLKNLRKRRPPLFRRRDFDWVLVETTGIAEPAPLLRTFLVEDDISVSYRVESVVGMADARNLDTALQENSAIEQLALADLLILNKTDLVSKEKTVETQQKLHRINPAAPVVQTQNAQIDVAEILKARTPRGLKDLQQRADSKDAPRDQSFTEGLEGNPSRHPHGEMKSVSLRCEKPLDEMKVQLWLNACSTMLDGKLIRYKGFLNLADRPWRCILQGVYNLYTVEAGEKWKEDEPRVTELVFIGRDLESEFLQRGLDACWADL
jgi:G3E family GTPase